MDYRSIVEEAEWLVSVPVTQISQAQAQRLGQILQRLRGALNLLAYEDIPRRPTIQEHVTYERFRAVYLRTPEFLRPVQNANNIGTPELTEVFAELQARLNAGPASERSVRRMREDATLGLMRDAPLYSRDYDEEDNVERRVAITGLLTHLNTGNLPADERNCNICREEFTHLDADGEPHLPVQIPCGHIFGEGCVAKWFLVPSSNYCPLCNANYTLDLLGEMPFIPDMQFYDSEEESDEGKDIWRHCSTI